MDKLLITDLLMGTAYTDDRFDNVTEASLKTLEKIARKHKQAESKLYGIYMSLLQMKYRDYWREEKKRYSGELQNTIKRMVRDKPSSIKQLP